MKDNQSIEIIRAQIEKLKSDNFNFKSWVLATDNYLKTIWGENTPKSQQLHSVYNTISVAIIGITEKDIEEFKIQWEELLNSYIIELENFEIPEPIKKQPLNNINVTVSQNQTQEQKQKQSIEIELIVNAIKEELTGKQFKELESIIREPESSSKIKKIVDKLLSFGSDVAAGILGNILANPQIIGHL
jgi:hypothetical protein